MSSNCLNPCRTNTFATRRQVPLRTYIRGASLLMVMMILVIVSILGVSGVQLALMSEKGARNDRDMQMAWQSAEAALQDAEFDLATIHGTKQLAPAQAVKTDVKTRGAAPRAPFLSTYDSRAIPSAQRWWLADCQSVRTGRQINGRR